MQAIFLALVLSQPQPLQSLPLPPGSNNIANLPLPPGTVEVVAAPKAVLSFREVFASAERDKQHAIIYVGAEAPAASHPATLTVRADAYSLSPGIYVILHDGKKLSNHHHRFTLDADVPAWLASRSVVSLPASPFPPNAEELAALPVGDDKLPLKGEKYVRSKYTQEIAVMDGRDRITAVSRSRLAAWVHQSGGMEGVSGYRSDVYRYVPSDSRPFIANLPVWNGRNFQYNRGWTRVYPNGTRFDDVLSNTETGKVFEHRIAFKKNGDWTRKVIFRDASQYPHGYEGLKQSCSSCHEQAGTGGYATGMIPGSDTIFSDPFSALE